MSAVGEGVGDMRGSAGHDAHPQVDADRSGTTTDKYGYFDRRTTPIFNTGVSSLGLDPSLMVAR